MSDERVETVSVEEGDDSDLVVVHLGDKFEEETEDDGVPSDFRAKSPKELYAEIQALKEQADVAKTIAKSITEARGDRPANMETPPPPDLEKAQKEFQEALASFDENLLRSDKPSQEVLKLMEKVMGPVLNQNVDNIRKVAKRVYLSNPETKDEFKSYEKEIDEYVKKQPIQKQADPDIYDEAFRMVRGAHAPASSEVAALKKELEELKAKITTTTKATPFQGGSSGGGVKSSKTVVREQSWDKSEAAKRGIPLDSWLQTSTRAKMLAVRAKR